MHKGGFSTKQEGWEVTQKRSPGGFGMEQRIYHGKLTPDQIARSLAAKFNRPNLRAQQIGSGAQVVVQFSSPQNVRSAGTTALSVELTKVPDGVSVQIGRQAWYGVAASLGMTALKMMQNPFNLIGRLDDVAQDIENLQLVEQVWKAIDETANAAGASMELSERLRRLTCSHCGVANPTGEPSCIACGAPLGAIQPRTCNYCGFVLKAGETTCPNCRRRTVGFTR